VRVLTDRALDRLRRVAELPDLTGTRYRLLSRIGRGGMGAVYAAEDEALGREVALKVVASPDSDAASRMLHEARIVARLEHPGIVPVHDAGILPDGRVFYAMKLVRGKRLDEVAAELPLPDRLRLFLRVCETVAFAHAHGVVHRDLKPENVMVGPFGEVLVLDWGVAKLLDAPSLPGESSEPAPIPTGARAGTSAGTVIGTPGYMPPEQAEGRLEEVGVRSDVWGLGAILHFLLAGRPPADPAAGAGTSGLETAPAALRSICARALQRPPANRYATPEELAADVARFLDQRPVSAHREGIPERLRRFASRYRTPILLVLTYLLVRSLLLLWPGR
jgi:serine/threonine protein kinase